MLKSGTPSHGETGRRRALPRRALELVLLSLATAACGEPESELLPVLPGGVRLAAFLDSMHVESRWIAGHHVSWRTGRPDARPVPIEGRHSHCSAFVAAVATKLGVEILRPPEHTQVLLAHAQCRWLAREGPQSGWEVVTTPLEAQELANRGMLVVACFVDPDPAVPGHIAIVRPKALSRRHIESYGPQVIQAGVVNYRSTSLAEGFRHHRGAWARHAVRFYSHATSP